MSKKNNARTFPRTDAGNAELIAAQFGAILRYDHKQGRWLVWSERRRRWNEDRQGIVRKLAIRAARHRLRLAAVRSARARDAEAAEAKCEVKWAFESEQRYRIDAALELAKSFPPISDAGDGWDAHPWLFGAANGVIELKTGRLREERPADRITKHSRVCFNASAECPRFEQFLNDIFDGNTELAEYVRRVIGYCMTGSVREQCLFCFYGHGGNGKTTLLNLLNYIFGAYGDNLPFSAFEMKNRNNNDLVRLAGLRLATARETSEGSRLNEARIKAVTGGDPITARRLYQEAFTFEPTHKLILAFNHRPVIADDSEGMWRRVRLIPFTRQFRGSAEDKSLPDTLKAEAPGILAWALRGCLAWQQEGLGIPDLVAEATAAYRQESDHIAAFIGDCCIGEAGAFIASSELWTAYLSWTDENEEVPLSRQVFGERLERRGFHRGRDGHYGTRGRVGLRLRPSGELPSESGRPSNADMLTDADAISDNSSIRGEI